MNLIKYIIFAVLTILALVFSRKYILNPQSRKFYRFFVFESILVLLLLNIDNWFTNPFSFSQIFSWLFLCFSVYLVISGFVLILTTGKPKRNFENTTRLIVTGLFKYIRHPLYSSLLFLGWGIFLKDPSYPAVIFVAIVSAFTYRMANIEEKENIKKFGEEYSNYMKNSKMIIPFIL